MSMNDRNPRPANPRPFRTPGEWTMHWALARPGRAAGIALSLVGVGIALGLGTAQGWLPVPRSPNVAAGEAGQAPSQRAAAPLGGSQVTLDAQHMQNVTVEAAGLVPFREVKPAIGQVAYNEDRSTPVFSIYAGRVVSLVAKPGDLVGRGAPLFNLDSTDLLASESADIAAVSALNAAKSHSELTRHALERAQILYDAKAIALRDFEQAKDDNQAAIAAETSVTGALAAARNALRLYGKSEEFIETLETTRKVDSILPIKSPIAGTVTLRKVGPGQYLQPDNQNPLYAVADLSSMWLRLNVPEADAPFVHVNQPVEVEVAALPGRVFKARIVHVSAEVDAVVRRVAVRAEVPNPEGLLKPQMFATARILADRQTESVGVPVNAVMRTGPDAAVWVEASPARFVSRSVKLGLEQNGFVQIVSGLQAGERVVSNGAIYLDNALAIVK